MGENLFVASVILVTGVVGVSLGLTLGMVF
jgi:hypothetical protein